MNFKLTVYPAIEAGNPHRIFLYESKVEVIASMDTLATMFIFMQDQAQVMDDYSNMMIIEEKIDGEWVEVES